MRKSYFISIVVIGFILVAINSYVTYEVARNFFFIWGEKQPVTLEVQPGQTVGEVVDKLFEQGVVKSKYLFLAYTYLLEADKSLQVGRYQLEAPMSIIDLSNELYFKNPEPQIVLKISAGKTISHLEEKIKDKFSFSDSITEKIIEEIQDDFFILRDAPGTATLEGYIYPETYYFDESSQLEDVLNKTLHNWTAKLTPELIQKMNDSKMNFHELITLASLVEKEVHEYKEKQIVAGIFKKRLSVGMPLQIDATVNYVTGKSLPQVTYSDIKVKSPYNTYLKKGLPPGPICNPTLESLKAVLNSKSSDYWFYLSTPRGETIFSATFQQHLEAKRFYLSS